MYEDPPRSAILAILGGRTVVAAVESAKAGAGLRRIACLASRRSDYVFVDTTPAEDHPARAYRYRAPIPTRSAWDGLPLLGRSGQEPGLRPDDPAAIAAWAAEDAAWGDAVPGPGRRLARGDDRPSAEAMDAFGPESAFPTDPAPVADLDGLAGKVVAVDCQRNTETQARYFVWLALSLVERAEIAGAPMPLIAGEEQRLAVLSRLLGWPVDNQERGSVCVPYRDPDAFRPWSSIKAMLAGREAAARGRCTVTQEGGLWRAEGDGRTVLAVRHPPPRAEHADRDFTAAVFVTVDPGPRTTRWLTTFDHRYFGEDEERYPDGPPSDAEVMADLCREAWLTDVGYLPGIQHRKPERKPVTGPSSEMVRPTPYTRLAETLAGLLGEDWDRFARLVARNRNASSFWSWVHASGGDGKRRLQFVLAYPALFDLALDAGVTAAVDAGRSPVPRLRGILDAPAWAVRWAAGTPDLPGEAHPGDPAGWAYQGALLKALGPDRIPRHGLGCYWLNRRVQSLDIMIGDEARIATAPLVAKLVAGPGRPDWRGMGEGVPFRGTRQIDDFLRALARWLGEISGRTGIERIEVAAEYGSLPALWEANRRWHAEPRLSASIGDVPPDATWPVPFAPADLGDGWTATAIPDVRGLVAEGMHGKDDDGMDGLAHCVATYASRCLAGRCVIVSLRTTRRGRTERVSTAQLVFGGGARPAVVQHHGLGNATPGEDANAALDRLLAGLASGAIPIVAGERPRPRAASKAPRPSAVDMLPVWRPILPPRWAKGDVVALARALPSARLPDEPAFCRRAPRTGFDGLLDLLDLPFDGNVIEI